MSLIAAPKNGADQGSLVNLINRACNRLWPVRPPSVRSTEVYYIYDNPYDGVGSARSAPVYGRTYGESQRLAWAAVERRRAEGFPEASAVGPYVKFVDVETGLIKY